ncbi:hypothetical protein SteCoe_33399 [Stentor coeruleus]|uniref:Uncharacterized protein n=1 Tax=Stentor coeruleus TaxID=5963 RepID=A0A1R2AWT6_9CILI|nr:hypothetical protein SteCoe_33399 [Stentor coeruleus]
MEEELVQIRKNSDIKTDRLPSRTKLIQSGMKRDKSIVTSRSTRSLEAQIRRKFGKPMSLERLMMPLKSIQKPLSPIRINSKEPKNTFLEFSANKTLTPSCGLATTPSKTSELLGKALKNTFKTEKTPQADTFNKKKDLENTSSTFKHKTKEEIKKPKQIPAFIKKIDTIQDNINNPGLYSSRNLRRVNDSDKNLEKILAKFNIRAVNDIHPNVNDASFYSALLVIIGIIDKKHPLKNTQVVETMDKFLSNPGIAVKTIKNLPFLLKDEYVDKEKIVVSFYYYKTCKDTPITRQNELIRSLLIEIYVLFNLIQTSNDTYKTDENENPKPSLKTKTKKNLENIKSPKRTRKILSTKQEKESQSVDFSIVSSDINNKQNTEDSAFTFVEYVEAVQKAPEKIEEIMLFEPYVDIKNYIKKTLSPKKLDLSMDYSYHKDCKNTLLEKFFRKNGREFRKNLSEIDFSDNTDISENEYLCFSNRNEGKVAKF